MRKKDGSPDMGMYNLAVAMYEQSNEKVREFMDKMLKEDTTKWLSMTDPIPVYTVYWRSWVDKQGQLQFRDDIYQFDDDAKMANSAVINSLIDHS